MIEGKPSRTALMTAVMRAHHYLTAPEPKILRDALALGLSGLKSKEDTAAFIENITAGFAALGDRDAAEMLVSHTIHAVVARSRLVEERFHAMEGLEQVVVLGAGLDTTAYRFADQSPDTQFFEVDFPATQVWKRERLADTGTAIPDNLTFVEFDFENVTLDNALREGGVTRDAITLFSWLGVQMYLTDEAVKSTLAVMGGFPKGSELVMDFVMPDYSLYEGTAQDAVKKLAQMVAKMGEPFESLYTEADLEQRLRDAGFADVDFYGTERIVDEFLGGVRSAYSMPDGAVSLLAATVG